MRFQVRRTYTPVGLGFYGSYDLVVLALDEEDEPFAAASSHFLEDRHVVAVHTQGDLPRRTGRLSPCDILSGGCEQYLVTAEELKYYPHHSQVDQVEFLVRLIFEHLPRYDLFRIVRLLQPA